MALAVTITDHWTDGKRIHVIGSIVASGNYVANGDTLNLASTEIKSASLPEFVMVKGVSGYTYDYVAGTTQANGKLKSYSAYATELAAGAYPAGNTGDTIKFYAIFPKFI